jgi:hypothetical protein
MPFRRTFAFIGFSLLATSGWGQPPEQVEVSPWRDRSAVSEPDDPAPKDPLANDAGCSSTEPVLVSAADGAIQVHLVRLAPERGITTRIRLRNDGAAVQNVTVVYSDANGHEVTRVSQQLHGTTVADFALKPGSLPPGAEFTGSAYITSDGNIAALSSWAAICTTH